MLTGGHQLATVLQALSWEADRRDTLLLPGVGMEVMSGIARRKGHGGLLALCGLGPVKPKWQ